MITHITGKVVEKTPTHVVIDYNGMGYEVHISLHTFSNLPVSEVITLHTHLIIKEDAHTLYGFSSNFEREIFKLLLSVSGVGASTARTMLSSLSPNQVKEAIALGDVKTIQSAKGIGTKTAQRIILDLKEKMIKVYAIDSTTPVLNVSHKDEALSALETLGFVRKQAEKICTQIIAENPEATIETIIKLALKKL